MSTSHHVENAVRTRYSAAAKQRVEALCCPVDYDPKYLQAIPAEILERDYGCGDPSRYLRPGETVLDLGSGAGKICFIASQVVGPQGRVIGVDMNDDMLALARGHAPAVGAAVGWHNVEFRKGRIQDLALDLERFDAALRARPLNGVGAFLEAEALAADLRSHQPLIPDQSVDVVVSNCVLNLVEARAKAALFRELFRVLRPGGRAVIADIVSDGEIPAQLQSDPELWSGCISGAFTEPGFLAAFLEAGFIGVQMLKLDPQPWRTVGSLQFRSMTLEAYRPDDRPLETRPDRVVIYKGPFRDVRVDGGEPFVRGQRTALSERAFRHLQGSSYAKHFEFLEPAAPPAALGLGLGRSLVPLPAVVPKPGCCDSGSC